MIKTQFEHGEWVEVRGMLLRKSKTVVDKTFYSWVQQSCAPFQAVFLGGRKLSDCELKRDYPNDEIFNSNFQNGALVCQKNRNPVKVLLSDVHKIPSPSVELCIHGSAVYVKA